MEELHVVLVCHTELDFGGAWGLFERIQPQIEQLMERVADRTGKRPRMTYCLTNAFLLERLADAFRFVEEGHEVGIHSHLPGAHRHPQNWPMARDEWEGKPRHCYQGPYAYRFDDDGFLNQDTIAGSLREIAIALGLPPPATHVSGMFTFQRRTIDALARAGFTVDCSLLPGIPATTHPATGDFVLADNSRHPDPYPYRPAIDDPWADGDAPVIELPVSANLGGGDIEKQIEDLRARAERNGNVDVFQSFWHHFEFAGFDWTRGTIDDAEKFLLACARHHNVVFSTAADAAAALRSAGS